MKNTRLVLLASFCLTLAPVHASEEPDANYVAGLFHATRHARLPFPDILKINPDLSDEFLYIVQRKFVDKKISNGAVIGGYKGGLIPKAPVGGVLFAHEILDGSPTLKRQNFYNLMVEAEIAFRPCGLIESPLANVEALQEAICEVYPAIELPDAAVENLADLLANIDHFRRLLIPTNMAVSHVLLGGGIKPSDVDLNSLNVRVAFDGGQIGYHEAARSTGDIWSRVLWVVNEFILSRGYVIGQEHIIIPGALTGIHPGEIGQYTVDYGALGQVNFQIQP